MIKNILFMMRKAARSSFKEKTDAYSALTQIKNVLVGAYNEKSKL